MSERVKRGPQESKLRDVLRVKGNVSEVKVPKFGNAKLFRDTHTLQLDPLMWGGVPFSDKLFLLPSWEVDALPRVIGQVRKDNEEEKKGEKVIYKNPESGKDMEKRGSEIEKKTKKGKKINRRES